MSREVNDNIFYVLILCNIVFTGADLTDYVDWVPEWDSFFKLNPFKDGWNFEFNDHTFEDTSRRFASSEHQENVKILTNLIRETDTNGIRYQLPTDAKEYEPYDSDIEDLGDYDFVIVGAGAGGAILANRLSEIQNWRILLLEAGDYGDNITDIPNMYYQVEFTKYNWGFNSLPQQTSCLGMVNFTCPMGRGRGVGGTTLINGLVYSRGSSLDFDRWADVVEDRRWSYDHVLPYFRRTENFNHRDRDAPVSKYVHGTGGLLDVEYHLPRSPQLNAFLKANQEIGHKIADYNGGTGLGASPAQVNTRQGRTLDVGTAFVLPALKRDNLKVMTNSLVTKVLIDGQKNAQGVLFAHNKRYFRVYANKEVIISAGAFQTPQLLMLSGIGPRSHLESLGIPVVQDLGVGSTLRDHAAYYGLNYGTNYTEPILPLEDYVGEFLAGFGPLASPGNNQGVSFYESQFTRGTGYPDYEIMMIPANATNDFSQRAFLLTNQTYEDVWKYVNRAQTFVYYIIALHAESIGTVRLRSKDPFEYPLIDNRFLSDPRDRDIEVLYEAVQFALKLSRTRSMREIGAKLQGHPMRACRHLVFPSKKYWFCAIRQMSLNLYHPVGTCPMGRNPINGAVVNSECNVHGIHKLRIVDGSVLPFTLAGHPVAAIIMVGERVSDFIKERYL